MKSENKQHAEVAKGKVLLAEPFSLDTNFKRSAVLLTEHDQEGSVGFIMNKPLNIKIEELLSNFPEFESEVYFGGPVATDSIHYLHDVGDILDDSIKIQRGIYWGGDFDKLKFLIDSKLVLPRNIRFYVGYSGWSSGQLHEEMDFGSWIVAHMHANYLFKSKASDLWETILTNKGNTFSVIAKVPEAPNWN